MALVQDQRFNVTTTTYVPWTFDQIAALHPDLLIVDLALRRQAGWELLERLQVEGLTRLIPVVVTSTETRCGFGVPRHNGNVLVATTIWSIPWILQSCWM
jgi:CheY-like chemotaxis protein